MMCDGGVCKNSQILCPAVPKGDDFYEFCDTSQSLSQRWNDTVLLDDHISFHTICLEIAENYNKISLRVLPGCLDNSFVKFIYGTHCMYKNRNNM